LEFRKRRERRVEESRDEWTIGICHKQYRTHKNKKVKPSTYVVEVAAEGREKPPKELDPRTPEGAAEVEEEAGAGTAGCSVAVAVAVGSAPNDRDAELPI
jgi:hypothetical protein